MLLKLAENTKTREHEKQTISANSKPILFLSLDSPLPFSVYLHLLLRRRRRRRRRFGLVSNSSFSFLRQLSESFLFIVVSSTVEICGFFAAGLGVCKIGKDRILWVKIASHLFCDWCESCFGI